VVLGECRTITHHEPMITLIGLRMVYERNVEAR
jgi:type III pantothenate kinase